MLARRVVTAVILLALLLPTIFIDSPLPWGLLTLVFLGAAAWEWSRLLPGTRAPLLSAALVMALGGGILFWRTQGQWPGGLLLAGCVLLAAFWGLLAPIRLRLHKATSGGWMLVVVLLLGCWIALYELRLLGAAALLSSMLIVWIADIAAYFAGRAWGKHKLAVNISPGKTWEGAFGGVCAVLLVGAAMAVIPAFSDSLQALLFSRAGLLPAIGALSVLTALSIVGDLHESLLKRQAGVKDSSQLLPGHGGVLDRIDALIPTMPVALLLFQLLT